MLIWNVFCKSGNRERIETYNIFHHGYFLEDCVKAAKEHRDDFTKFANDVESSLLYYFWGKCEWEIILSGWPPSDQFHNEKIDVFDQIRMNWQVFIRWLWDHREELLRIGEDIV